MPVLHSPAAAKRDISSFQRPLLRWVGGKHRLASRIVPYLPQLDAKATYVEPFLGAASLFFRVQPARSLLADSNLALISFYRQLRDCRQAVTAALGKLKRRTGRASYLEVRRQFNEGAWAPAQAARFLYLNVTCFNGIYRVNQRGEFNVPHGRRESFPFPSTKTLSIAAKLLRGASLRAQCFRKTLAGVKKGDFVYVDPPYPPLTTTAYFTHYTRDRFSDEDQTDLASLLREIDKRGARFLMSNADTPRVRQLYRGFTSVSLSVTRSVSCKAEKHQVSELLISNYPLVVR